MPYQKYCIAVDIRIPKDPPAARASAAGRSLLPSVRHCHNLCETGLLHHQGNNVQNYHFNKTVFNVLPSDGIGSS